MRVLLNPVVARMVVLMLAGLAAFAVGAFVIHRFRKDINAESESLSQSPLSAEGLPIHSYHAVIQQLKQQKHELASQQLSDRRKARASEALSAAVFANLPCGVLFFNSSGLLRQANPAARQLLGFASPIGMSLADLFRAAALCDDSGSPDRNASLLDAIAPALTGESAVRALVIKHVGPDRTERTLGLTAAPVMGEDARPIGTTVILADRSEIAEIRKQVEARGDLSAEMALALRTSLATICGYAQQLGKSRDTELTQQLTADISNEAAQLDHALGGFLTGGKAMVAGSS